MDDNVEVMGLLKSEHFCETCDRSFKSDMQLSEHTAQHRTCGLEGCQFTAHPGVVAKHIQMQHDSGLFKKLKNLYTPEDIAKWREERKRSYPSKDNVEKRQAVQEEKQKRGETLVNENQRFGHKNFNQRERPYGEHARGRGVRGNKTRGRGRLPRPYPHPAFTPAQKGFHGASNINEDTSTWCGNLRPFCGTGLCDEVIVPEVEVKVEEFSDNEWTESSAKVCPRVPIMSNALSSLVGLYGSDSDESETEVTETTCLTKQPPTQLSSNTKANTGMKINGTNDNTNDLEGDVNALENSCRPTVVVNEEPLSLNGFPECVGEKSVPMESLLSPKQPLAPSHLLADDDKPSEVPILHNSPCENTANNNMDVLLEDSTLNCNSIQQDSLNISGGLQTGGNPNKRKRSHRNHSNKDENPKVKNHQQNVPSKSKPFPSQRRRPTLLQELLRNEIRHERNVLLQCVRYTVENNFFQKPSAHTT